MNKLKRQRFKLITFKEYKKFKEHQKHTEEEIKEQWNKLSKGFEFVLKDIDTDYINLYSIDYINIRMEK